jgi:uncharacterized protein (DUF1684 family)
VSDDDWTRRIESERRRKEEYFAEDPHSPVAGGEFAGLEYYPPDPDFRFVLPLYEHDGRESITVATSTDGEREYLRWGEFRFSVGGQELRLQAYRNDPGEERLWVPFRDETSGGETYGAGRYLDLDADDRVDGEWVLDFNLAYNPTCAYNEAYECPLVPMENWLDVRIEAGEKDYPGDPVEPHG